MPRNQRTTNATEIKTGRYSQGGLTDRFNRRLGWWERVPLERATSDISFVITKQFEGRPDLVSAVVYEKDTLAWLVLQYNNIVDINTEFVTGKVLTLPTPERAQTNLLSRRTGGKVVE